jgi:hypothetical protein
VTRTSKEKGAISLFLFFIFIGFYGLSYSGIAVTDDEQLFASAAISLSRNGDLRAPQLSGNERLQGEYNSVGPLHPAIGSLLLRLNLIRSIGSVQLLFILPPLYTALTGLLILRFATLRGYPLHTGVFAALVFCLGTIAWPYSKTYFREPLAMLLLMVVWLSFEFILERKFEHQSRLIGFAVFCLALGGLLLTKIQLIVVVPIFSLVGLWSLMSNRKTTMISKKFWVGGLALIILSSLMVYLFLDSILPMGVNSRISVSFLEFAWRRILSTPHSAFWNAIVGALFSIGKGFFWYSPITILAMYSFFGIVSWRRREIYIPWLILFPLLVTQALAYDEDWWNITWSTRFLLPVLPLMVVASLPVLDHLLSSDKRIYRLIPFLLFSLGFVIQLSAVLISDITYLIQLYQEYGTVYPDPFLWGLGTAPVVGHIRMILEGVNWDLVLWRTFNIIPVPVLMAVFFMISICLVGIFGLWHSLFRKKKQIRPTIALITSCIIVGLLGSILLQIANHDNRYYADREDFALTNVWIQQNAKPGDAILVDAYLDPIWYYLWSFGESKIPMYSLPNRDRQVRTVLTSLPERPSHNILDQLLGNPYDRIWLVCEKRCSPRVAYQKDVAFSTKSQQTIFFLDTHSRSQTEIRLIQMHDSDS